MAYEVVHEEKEDCGCVTKYKEHDCWITSSYTITIRCPRHQAKYEEEERLANERRRLKEEERKRWKQKLKNIEIIYNWL